MKTIFVAAALICAVFVSGCATVVKGSSQSIAIATPPATGANCVLSSKEGNWYVASPGVVRVEKSKEDIAVRCTKSGWQDASQVIPSNFEGWTVGNVLIGGMIGVGIDAASGAINKYPSAFNVPMTPEPGNLVAMQEASKTPVPPVDGPPHIDTSGINLQPNYPSSAITARERGSAVIGVSVRDDGTVGQALLIHSSGYTDLDTAAINAVLHWKFQPAIENGEPVDGETSVQITFQPPS